MLIYIKTTKPKAHAVSGIERKNWPVAWYYISTKALLLVDNLITKGSTMLYILRVCKFYSYSLDQLN